MATGGPVEEVSIAGRIFAAAGDADTTRKLGGFENEFLANGNGTARNSKTRMPWMAGGIPVEIDNDREDQEFLQNIANGFINVAIAITYVDGNVYQGTGNIVDGIEASSQAATATLAFSGPGELTKQ